MASQPDETEAKAYAFLRPHFSSSTLAPPGRPFVTLTYAQSLDGFIAAPGRKPLLLSSPSAMVLTHALRATHDAILVGVDTVISDNPSLTTRFVAKGPGGTKATSPCPVILDSTLRSPLDAKLFRIIREDAKKPIVVTTDMSNVARKTALEAIGVRVLVVQSDPNTGRVSVPAALDALYKEGIKSVMVEGGATVIESLLTRSQQAIDLVVVTVAPVWVGTGVQVIRGETAFGGSANAEMTTLPKLTNVRYEQFGVDMVLAGVIEHASI
ncbi:hypothetical protein SpCBS45565_g00608 [Spizellomyces sp. 'palustris']|nr:hypothetical protein SpCBS45565_g00608 [Spizellomyces sp. 'palustris']